MGTWYIYFKLPDIIPVHFNSLGKVDDFGNKGMLLILPALETILYFVLTKLNKYPHMLNYIPKITIDDAERQYTLGMRMLRFTKLAILIIFSLLILFTYFTTIGLTKGIGIWFLPFTFLLLLLPMVILIRQSLKK